MKTYFPRTQKSSILGFWTAQGPQKPLEKAGCEAPRPFGAVSGAPGAIQTPKIDDFWLVKNPCEIKTDHKSIRFVFVLCPATSLSTPPEYRQA